MGSSGSVYIGWWRSWCTRPLVQVRIICLIHHFRATHTLVSINCGKRLHPIKCTCKTSNAVRLTAVPAACALHNVARAPPSAVVKGFSYVQYIMASSHNRGLPHACVLQYQGLPVNRNWQQTFSQVSKFTSISKIR